MLACRFAQGVGAAGSGVVAAAIVRDLFSGIGFVRATARLAAVTGLAPVVAPFLGSLVLNFVAWRGLFIVVAAYGLVALALSVLLLPETHPHARMSGNGAPGATNRYRAVLADRRFVGAALVSGMIVSAVFTYMTSSSFLFQEHYGLGPQAYSVVFAVNAVGFVFGSQASSRLLRRFQPTQVLARTLPALTGLGLGIAVTTLVSGSPYLLTVLTAGFFIFAGASGPCVGVIAMTPHALRAGTAAALLGAVSFGLAGITAPLAGILGGDSAMPTGLVMALTMALAVVAFRTLVLPDHTGGLRWRVPHGARTRGILSSWWQAGNDFREDLQPGSTHRDEVLETMRRS